MQIDLELYRREVLVQAQPPVRLSVIDVSPEAPLRTLVFVHGFGGQAKQWQYQLLRFANANRVIAVDLRGHGRSDKPRGAYTMPEIQADLLHLLERLKVSGKIVLVGHSFGGAVVAEFAAAHPEQVEKLILIATAGEYHLRPLYRSLLALPLPLLNSLGKAARNWLGAPPHVLQPWYVNNLSRWNGWSLFRSLSMPTLIIRGHLDAVFARNYFEDVGKTIPDAEEVDVGASGHLVMLERREAVNRAISRFIQSEGRGSWSRDEAEGEENARLQLVKERPWLPHYDDEVPYTVALPRVPLQSLLDSAARRFPARPAVMFEGNHLPYHRLVRETNRFANLLLSLGLKKGERVMIILPNVPQMVIAFYGALKAGGVAVFTLPTTEPGELVRQIRDSESAFLVTLTTFDELIQEIVAQLGPGAGSAEGAPSPLRHIIFTHIADYLPASKRAALEMSPAQRKLHLLDIPLDASMHVFNRSLYGQSEQDPEIEADPEALAVIQYTGGTTDRPKGVMLSHRNLVANALQTRHWLPDAKEGQERFLCVVPFTHSYGLTAALNVPLALGAALIIKPRFEVLDILQTIQRYKPTIFPGVPQMYVAIKDYPGVRRFGVASIRACISGSAPLPVEVQEAFEKLTRGRLVEGYGLTEASPVTHSNPLNGQRKVGSIGVPLPSTEARVVDLRKGVDEVPVGHIGELAVRGPQVMLGYWKDPRATRRALTEDGWLLTGDVAQVDGEGYFRIVARKVDMWYPSKPGEPAFPRDVEEVLFEIPQVKEAAVVAIAGQPIAFIIARQERPTAEAVLNYCKRRLPPELVPRLVIFVDDFPRTFIGKVLRRELAKRFKENKEQIIDGSTTGLGG